MRDFYGRNIEFIETKENNLSLNVDNILLHSRYYPEKEAKTFVNKHSNLYKNKISIVVYGLALGYHIKHILNEIGEECIVKIFDLDKELFNVTSKERIIKEIIKDGRVELYIGNSESFLKNFSKALNYVEDILIYKPSLKVLPQEFEVFKACIERFQIGRIAVENFGQSMNENNKANLNVEYKNIEWYLAQVNFKNKPILIISAGPSLDSVMSDLKIIKNMVTIFAVGSALKPLLSKGIKPDMFCIIDSEKIVYEQIRNCENMDIPLCFLNTASNLVMSSYKGPKFMFYNETKGDNIVIDTGKSVATAVISIAIKTGGNPILFVGQDLAYLNNKTHCNDYPNGSNNAERSVKLKKVLGVEGYLLDTTPVLLYFKNWIENTIRENPNVKFINCSKGAMIEGTIEMEILEAVNKFI